MPSSADVLARPDEVTDELAAAVGTLEPTTATPAEPTADESDSALDRPVTSAWLLRFAAPTVGSMVVFNALGMVDGIFAARIIAPEALAVVNLVWPLMGFVMAVAFMLAIGGSALVAKQLGEGRRTTARQNFTMLTVVTLVVSAVLSAIGLLFPDLVLNILGVDAYLHDLSLQYLTPLLWILPVAMLGFFIQQYFITEGRPNLGFYATLAGGVVNIGLNFLFIGHLGWGLRGAALATGIGYSVPAVLGVWFFARNRGGVLRFVRPRFDLRALGTASLNGSSEMINMLAWAVNIVIMNNILMDLVGFEGVAASGIMWVGQGLLMSLFLGYASGVAPIISYNYGKGDRERLTRAFRRSMAIIAVTSAVAIVLGWQLMHALTIVYVPAGTPIYDLAIRAFWFMLIGFVFMGFNGFASVLFTALNNGVISGILSFFRTFVFILAMLLLLPLWLGVDGVWLAPSAAEALAFVMTVWLVGRYRKHYGYA